MGIRPGTRVQVPAYSDDWMRGARFGTAVEGGSPRSDPFGRRTRVRLDVGGYRSFLTADLRVEAEDPA